MKTILSLFSAIVLLSVSASGQNSSSIRAQIGGMFHTNSEDIFQSIFDENSPWSENISKNADKHTFDNSTTIALGMEWSIKKLKIGFRNQIQSQSFISTFTNAENKEITHFRFNSVAMDQGLSIGYEAFTTVKSENDKGLSITPRMILGVTRRLTKFDQSHQSIAEKKDIRFNYWLSAGYATLEIGLNFHVSKHVDIIITPGYQYMNFGKESLLIDEPTSSSSYWDSWRDYYRPKANYSAFYLNSGISFTF